jgi:hypothetical protein
MDNEETTTAPSESAATPTPRSETRYPLAYDANGNPLTVPSGAVFWRVRRGGGRRGRPRNMFDAETGRQLEIPLGATLQDLIETNVPADRYLLYPVDAQGIIIPGIVAVTEVPRDEAEDEAVSDEPVGLSEDSKNPHIALLARQQQTIQAMAGELSKSLAAAVSGYAPVRPQAPMAPTPIIMEQSAEPTAQQSNGVLDSILNMKPEQMMQLAGFAKMMFDMIKGGGVVGAPPAM